MRYEKLAGRAGMVGASSALALELLFFDNGLFTQASATPGLLPGAALLLAAAAGMAVASKRRGSSRALLEPLLAALTSRGGSQGSVSTYTNVDPALDALMDSVFTSAFMAATFGPLAEEEPLLSSSDEQEAQWRRRQRQ